MLTYFYCPNGKKVSLDTCPNCPRPEGRCLTLPTLKYAGNARNWYGKPSTTQCLNPTRMEYLKIKYPYGIYPARMAYAILGTSAHEKLERAAEDLETVKAELHMGNQQTSGIADELEPDELNHGNYKLVDYKTWGSAAIAKFINNPDNRQTRELELQLNNYRIIAESLGYPISRLQVQFTVRDGGIKAAIKNGIDFDMRLFPVNILDNDDVLFYFYEKSQALIKAVQSDTLPALCEYAERWEGARCRNGYCDVFRFCPEGALINKVKYEGK